MVAAFAMSVAASAQTTRVIKGAVIDKNGNPLPGATVTATGGSEVTTVDADGTFSMEVPVWLKSATAQYAGMAKKKMKVGVGDMIFRMKPKVNQWFIVADYAHLFEADLDIAGNMGGLMAGRLGKWGWYGKFNLGKIRDIYSYQNFYYDYYYDYYYYRTNDVLVWTLTAGITKRIINPLHVYIGLGAGCMDEEYTFISPEIGLIGKIKNHFLLHVGYQPMIEVGRDSGEYVCHVLNVGLGYAF